MRYTKPNRIPVPSQTTGHLYYVRLKSSFGPLYKLGFTSMSSVRERFAFKGNGDEKLIDEIYLFVYDREAFHHETRLHGHFGHKKAFGHFSSHPGLPLYQNGQSELYYADILGLDASYTEARGQQTFEAIRQRLASTAAKPHWAMQLTVLVCSIPFKAISMLFKAGVAIHHGLTNKQSAAPLPPTGPSRAQQRYDKEIKNLLDWIGANRIDPAGNTPGQLEPVSPLNPSQSAEWITHPDLGGSYATDPSLEMAIPSSKHAAPSVPEAAKIPEGNRTRWHDADVPLVPPTSPAPSPTIGFDTEQAKPSTGSMDASGGARLVAALKKAQAEEASSYVALSHALDEELVGQFVDAWDWRSLSMSASIRWSIGFIERFKERWDWPALSGNQALPWCDDLISRFSERWHWSALSANRGVPWTSGLITRHQDVWDWDELSENDAIPFDAELIRQFADRWEWYSLSENKGIPLTAELIERFDEHWVWRALTVNPRLQMSTELIESFTDRWDWGELTVRDDVKWSTASIDRYADRLHWAWLSGRDDLPWSMALIERFQERWDWQRLAANAGLPWSIEVFDAFSDRWVIESTEFGTSGLAGNEAFPWHADVIQRFAHQLNWKQLSANTAVPWTKELITSYHDRWDWSELSKNRALPWSAELIDRFRDRWDWGGHRPGLTCNPAVPWTLELAERYRGHLDMTWLAANTTLPWSEALVARFEDDFDWTFFSRNEAVPWTLSLIEKYADRLHWGEQGLHSNTEVRLPVLSRSQVIDVMLDGHRRKSERDAYIDALIRRANTQARH